jgi:hypothetical protein
LKANGSESTKTAEEEGTETDPLPNKQRKTQSLDIQCKHAHTDIHNIKFVQINLHHSKAASANLCQLIAEGKVDIALIQEPWVYKGQVRGLTNSRGTIYAVAPSKNSRSCIYIRNHINALPLLEFCSRDTTTVRITYAYGGGNRELVVTSAYLPYDSDEPTPSKEMKDIID